MAPYGKTSSSGIEPPALAAGMDVVLALAAACAATALVLEYGGFGLQGAGLFYVRLGQAIAVGIFILDRFARLAMTKRRAGHLRENWIDFALLGLGVVFMAVNPRYFPAAISIASLYVFVNQAYLLPARLFRGVTGAASTNGGLACLMVGSFVLLSLAGAGLLMLPAATTSGRIFYFQEALFTAVSAGCLVGLTVRDTGTDFTLFGQAVILALIQLGGLAALIFGALAAARIGRNLAGTTATAFSPTGNEGKTALAVAALTLALEVAGAVLAYPMFAAPRGPAVPTAGKAVWDSVFHSVSAMCNAGFSLYEKSLAQGAGEWALPLRDHWQVLGVIAPLIVLGGLGFPVLMDCAGFVKGAARRLAALSGGDKAGAAPALSLYSKLALATTALLIVGGAGGLLLVEPHSDARRYGAIGRTPVYYDNTRNQRDWPRMNAGQRFQAAMFQSISARTAGFSTIDPTELSNAGKLWMCGLMIVGGSPGSAAGGMKTVTAALILLAVWSALRRRDGVGAFGRDVPTRTVQTAFAAGLLYLLLVGAVTLLLSMAMRRGLNAIDLLFEAVSACGAAGLSTGVTAGLNVPGKSVIIAGMFIGRTALPALMLIMAAQAPRVDRYHPKEDIILG